MFNPLHIEAEPVTEPEPAPPLTESARLVYAAARNVAGAWSGTFGALRRLLVADIALAREAVIRGVVLLCLAAVLFGTAWLLLATLAVWGLYEAGAGWGFALAVPLVVSAVLGGFAFWQAARTLRLADLDASRRQLTLWFGTPEEVTEANQAPPGTLDAGAPAPDTQAANAPGDRERRDHASKKEQNP
jgi:hypothetical protein